MTSASDKSTLHRAFGERLRATRTKKGLSVRKLAKALGLSATYISNIERAILPPPADVRLLQWAEVLGIDPDKMFWEARRINPKLEGKLFGRFQGEWRELIELLQQFNRKQIRELTMEARRIAAAHGSEKWTQNIQTH
ncbi:MAG: putative transcriptional regulator [Candidatus Angelobacter sp.]|nr:putative transcriptional regulator [Candidatus Angelobacter sp.]